MLQVKFVREALCSNKAVFEKQSALQPDLVDAIKWNQQWPGKQGRAAREKLIKEIEVIAEHLSANGAADSWLADATDDARLVAAGVNGPLFEMLARSIKHHDAEAVDLLRKGGPLTGVLARFAYLFRCVASRTCLLAGQAMASQSSRRPQSSAKKPWSKQRSQGRCAT